MTTLKSLSSKKGKKGFTLTELAIVIAVIAILIAVLVPTFTSVITSARRTTAAETAKNAITEYNVETYTTVPDGSIVVYGDYYWTVENGSFEVSEDGDPDDVTLTNMVAYSWGSEVDAGIADVKLYTPASAMTTAVAKILAKNYANNYVSGDRVVTYVGVAYGTTSSAAAAAVKLTSDSTSDYYFYSISNGAVTGSVMTSAPGADGTDAKTYEGVIIGYTSESETAEIAVAGMKMVSDLSAGTYYVKVTTANKYVYYYAVTYTAATGGETEGTYSAKSLDSALYGTEDGTEAKDYTNATVYYKTQSAAETEIKEAEEAAAEAAAKAVAEAAAEEADTEDSDEYTYATVTVGETTYYFELSGESGTYTATIDEDAENVDSNSYTEDSSANFTETDGYTVALYKDAVTE